jgi:glycosyltransferase involved in cell wall biosynthesis
MASPRISIITPSFNQAGFLEQAISSVLGQNYNNLEYIVVDGGSTDGSVDIIRKFDDRIAYWVSEEDRGQTHALNKGLKKATGDIIAYLNSDDFYLEGTLARVAENFSRHPDVDMVHGRCRIVDEHGVKVGERCASITKYEEILDLWDVWWKGRNFVQPEVFWTKRIGDKIGPFREDLFWVMDYEYWLRMLRAGCRVKTIDAELAAFRLQPQQKSRQRERTSAELLRVARPFIFEEDRLLTWPKRVELKGKFKFHTAFLKEAERSLARGEARWQRWLRLGYLLTHNPEILTTQMFQKRVLGVLPLRSKSKNLRVIDNS